MRINKNIGLSILAIVLMIALVSGIEVFVQTGTPSNGAYKYYVRDIPSQNWNELNNLNCEEPQLKTIDSDGIVYCDIPPTPVYQTDNATLNLHCSNITGAASDLCTITSGAPPVVTSWINYTTTEYATNNVSIYTVITNLTSQLATNSTYVINCNFLTYSAAVTTGEQLQVNLSGAPLVSEWSFNSQVSATTRTSLQSTSTSSNAFADTGSAGTNIRDQTLLQGYVVTSTTSNSNLTFAMKTEITASNAAFARGSYCEYNKVR